MENIKSHKWKFLYDWTPVDNVVEYCFECEICNCFAWGDNDNYPKETEYDLDCNEYLVKDIIE